MDRTYEEIWFEELDFLSDLIFCKPHNNLELKLKRKYIKLVNNRRKFNMYIKKIYEYNLRQGWII